MTKTEYDIIKKLVDDAAQVLIKVESNMSVHFNDKMALSKSIQDVSVILFSAKIKK